MDTPSLENLKSEMPYQWKINTLPKELPGKAQAVAYIDARDVENRLDDVVGPGNWADEIVPLKDDCSLVKCRLSILVNDKWIGKEDIGTASDYEKEKGAFSDAFKRAAVKWGIGRFLYDLPTEWIQVNQFKKPVDENNRQIHDLTKYINDRRAQGGQSHAPVPVEEQSQSPAKPVSLAIESWREVTLHFGKNKGIKLGDVDAQYLGWLQANWQPNPEYNSKNDQALLSALNASMEKREEKTNDQTDEIRIEDIPF